MTPSTPKSGSERWSSPHRPSEREGRGWTNEGSPSPRPRGPDERHPPSATPLGPSVLLREKSRKRSSRSPPAPGLSRLYPRPGSRPSHLRHLLCADKLRWTALDPPNTILWDRSGGRGRGGRGGPGSRTGSRRSRGLLEGSRGVLRVPWKYVLRHLSLSLPGRSVRDSGEGPRRCPEDVDDL